MTSAPGSADEVSRRPGPSYPPVRHPDNVDFLRRRREQGTEFGILWGTCASCGTLACGFDGSWHWWHVNEVDCAANVVDIRKTGPSAGQGEHEGSFVAFDEAGQAWHLLGHNGLMRELELAVADLPTHRLADLVAAAVTAVETSTDLREPEL